MHCSVIEHGMTSLDFHVLFLVLESIEKEKIEQTTYTFCDLISSGGLVGLFSDRGPRSCYLFLFATESSQLQICLSKRPFLSRQWKIRRGKNDISCFTSCFRGY